MLNEDDLLVVNIPPQEESIIKAVAAGLDNAVVMCILLVGGAFLFALSDMMLAVNSLRKPRPP